jgi:hypothetical protein
MPHVHTGHPSGMVPGARPGLLLPDLDGRNISITRRPPHYVRSTDRLRLHRPPGRSLKSYRPPQDLPRDSSQPARIRTVRPRIAPSGGGPGRRTAERAGCCPLRRGPGLSWWWPPSRVLVHLAPY